MFSNCEFPLRYVAFMGSNISGKGIDVDMQKTEIVMNLHNIFDNL